MTNTEKSITAVAAGITIALVITALRAHGYETKIEEPVVIEETVAEIPHIVLNLEQNEPEVIENTPIPLGEFRVTAYCPCEICCGKWSEYGLTASGTVPEEGRTIAVDKHVIPLGETVTIDGVEYIAEDTGSAIKGNRIDIYFEDHQEALDFGVQYKEVFVEE
jgi:3D (Asp-Asp-Asp) domain-containing protein